MMEDDGFAFVKIRHGDREIGRLVKNVSLCST
ncbi:MAG: hypothetical protein BWZ00_00868 [Bacteroidetes bacterium ADurb.BinA174]|nr:MAG: hypothetical protein BWZ00_00868 [Bacteroidetes bacterium ADurb.BinA174]